MMQKWYPYKTQKIPAAAENFSLIASNVTRKGQGCFLFANKKAMKLIICEEFYQTELDLPSLDFDYQIVDLFSDGRVLIADRRSRWRNTEDFDLNAAVITPDQQSVERFHIGDGITKIALDALDRIWVSYSYFCIIRLYVIV